MWKESYRIGIEIIDTQHIALFKMVEDLLKNIERNADKEAFRNTISFLKDYVVIHFRDEEAYQASIAYPAMDAHKKLHRDFTQSVLNYEKKLIETDYNIAVIKDLAGTLTAWLIYHVADADQKIAGIDRKTSDPEMKSYLSSFTSSIAEVLSKMTGIDRTGLKGSAVSKLENNGGICVEIGLIGDKPGSAFFCFSKELACNLFRAMTFMEVTDVDELVCSALAEISNISSGNAATYITEKGFSCDIKTPSLHDKIPDSCKNSGAICINSEMGSLCVAVNV